MRPFKFDREQKSAQRKKKNPQHFLLLNSTLSSTARQDWSFQLQSKRFPCACLLYFLAQCVLSWFYCLSAVMCHSHTAALMYFMLLPDSISYLKAPLKVFIYLMDLWVIASKLCINRSKSVLYYSPAIVKYFPLQLTPLPVWWVPRSDALSAPWHQRRSDSKRKFAVVDTSGAEAGRKAVAYKSFLICIPLKLLMIYESLQGCYGSYSL